MIQLKSYQTRYWDKELEQERATVHELKRISDTTNAVEDYRVYKNYKNRHVKQLKKKKRKHFTKIYGSRKGTWKQLKNDRNTEDQGLNEAVIKGELCNSPVKLAQAFGEHLVDKITTIANSRPLNTIIGEKVFKWSVNRQPEDFQFRMLRIRHLQNHQ